MKEKLQEALVATMYMFGIIMLGAVLVIGLYNAVGK